MFLQRPAVPMDNNFAERTLRGAVIGRRLSFGSDSETGAQLTALMYSVVETLALNDIDVHRWLQEWLNAANGGRAPPDLAEWLPWSMSQTRWRALMGRHEPADRVPLLRARLLGRGNGVAARAHRRAARPEPLRPVESVLPAFHRLVQARRRAQGHDGARHQLAMHKDGLIVLPPPKWGRNPGANDLRVMTRRWNRRPRPSMRCARSACEPCSGARPKASSGTRLSPATTTSVTKPWSAHRCATPCMTATASYWLCSGSPPRHANWRRSHRFIGWTPTLREKNLPKSIDNARFLILPWMHPQPRLAHPVRRVPSVDCGLDRALSHRAPVDRNVRGDAALHWRHLQGLRMDPCRHTQGRGRYDRHKKYDKPKKTIWLRPLRKDWKRTLNR